MRITNIVGTLALTAAPILDVGAEGPFEQKAFAQLLAATQSESLKDFVALGDDQFRSTPEAEFKKATCKFAPLLKIGYTSTYLGEFKETEVHVYYWKLEFPSEPRDWLAKLAIANGKVSGFFITRP